MASVGSDSSGTSLGAETQASIAQLRVGDDEIGVAVAASLAEVATIASKRLIGTG